MFLIKLNLLRIHRNHLMVRILKRLPIKKRIKKLKKNLKKLRNKMQVKSHKSLRTQSNQNQHEKRESIRREKWM